MSAGLDGSRGDLIRRPDPDESVNSGPLRSPTGTRPRMLVFYLQPC